MDNGKNSVSMVVKKNNFRELMTECKTHLEINLKNLLAKHPVLVEATIAGVKNGIECASLCLALSTIGSMVFSAIPVLKPFKGTTRGRWIIARETAVLASVDTGITCAMKRKQEKVDVQTTLVAGFGAGIMSSIVQRDPPAFVISCGIMVALIKAALFKVVEECKSRRKAE